MGHLPTSDVCRRKKKPFLTNPRKQLLVQTFGQQTSVLYTIAFFCATLTSEGKIASGQSFRATGTLQPQTLRRSRCRYRGGFMITLFLLLKLLFGGGKENSHHNYDEEEEDYEEMLIMGILDDD